MVEFGERLRAMRKKRGLTQAQLASLVGVKNSVISFYEVGDRFPSPAVLMKLSSALHVSVDALLGLQKEKTIDVSGLSEQDIQIVQDLVISMRDRNHDDQ